MIKIIITNLFRTAYDPLNSFGLDEFRNGKIIIPVFDSEMWYIETIYNDNAKKKLYLFSV